MEEEQKEKKKYYQRSAKTAMMDLLAKRDHSPRELRTKLGKKYPKEDVEEALLWVQENGWIASNEELSEKFTNHLHMRRKGIRYINAKLTEKGLPLQSEDFQTEYQKALDLVENKRIFKDNSSMSQTPLTYEELEKLKAKAGRFLVSRGFSMSVVRKVVYEHFRKLSKDTNDE